MAKDTYPFYGPLDIRIIGANGDMRDFIALSDVDRKSALTLVAQLSGAMQQPAEPIEEAAQTLPHYRIVVNHLGKTYPTMPWAARSPDMSVVYYPGGQGVSFLMIAESQADPDAAGRWVEPAGDVTAMLERHLHGLAPIGTDAARARVSTAPLGLALGAVLIAAVSLLLFEDRRRWRLLTNKGSAGSKGT